MNDLWKYAWMIIMLVELFYYSFYYFDNYQIMKMSYNYYIYIFKNINFRKKVWFVGKKWMYNNKLNRLILLYG